MLYEYQLQTNTNQQFINITELLNQSIKKSNIEEGIAIIYCPHTTAGITINENTDSDVERDLITTLNRIIPVQGDYHHYEGNSHAHLKSSLMGVEKTIIINDSKPVLGTWQGIYFCEFDGPRNRRVYIKIMKE